MRFSALLSLLKLGPVGLMGVWKFNGLGSRLAPALSEPRPKFQSGIKLEGLGNNCSLINRDGKAEIGVAMSLFPDVPFG